MTATTLILWLGMLTVPRVPPPDPDALMAPPARWVVEGDRLIDERDALDLLPWAPGDSIPANAEARAATILATRLRESGWWGSRVTSETRDHPLRSAFEVKAGETRTIEIGG